MKHLDEVEFQNHLDGNVSEDGKYVTAHLEYCEICQAKMDQYKNLYGELGRGLEIQLSASFAESVISKLPAGAPGKSSGWFWEILLIVLGAVLGLGLMAYFLDFKPIIAGLIGSNILEVFGPFFTKVGSLFAGVNMGLVAFAGLLLLLISAADHVLVQKKFATKLARH